MSKHNLNVAKFSFDVDCLFDLQEVRKSFAQYLKQVEYNEEPLLFVNECEKLLSMTEKHEEFFPCAQKIFLRYVCAKNAERQINLSARCRINVQQALTTVQYVPICQAYRTVMNYIVIELKSENFTRYLRSKQFQVLFQVLDVKQINSVASPTLAMQFDYQEQDFIEPCIADRDFEFMEQLIQDSFDWQLLGHEKYEATNSSMHAYWHEKNYLNKVSWGKQTCCAKFELVLPYSMDFVAQVLIPACNQVSCDPAVKSMNHVEYLCNAEAKTKFPKSIKCNYRSLAVSWFEIMLPFPLNQRRRFYFASSVQFKPDKEQILLVLKPVKADADKYPLPKNWIEMYNFACSYFKRLDDDRCIYGEVLLANLGGWATSKSLQKLTTLEQGKGLHKKMIQTLQLAQQGKLLCNYTNDATYKCLLDCCIDERRKQHDDYLSKLLERME